MRRYGDEQFTGEGGPLLFAGNALHTDLAPEAAGSAVYGWLLCMLAQSVGFPVPEGGSGAIVDALVARLHDHGGRLTLDTSVTSIHVEGGRATGVRLASGELVPADAVLADVGAPQLYLDLVGERHLPAQLVEDLGRFQWDSPTMKVNWALSRPVPWIPAGARGAGTVHLGVDMAGLTFYAACLASRRMPDEPFVLLGQMTTADPTRSPAGTESAWAYTHVPEGLDLSDEDVEVHAARIESLIERHAPGFRASHTRPRRAGPCGPAARRRQSGAAARWAVAPLGCTSSWCSARCPGWLVPRRPLTGFTSPVRRRIPGAGCTAVRGPTPRPRPYDGLARQGGCSAPPSRPRTAGSIAEIYPWLVGRPARHPRRRPGGPAAPRSLRSCS